MSELPMLKKMGSLPAYDFREAVLGFLEGLAIPPPEILNALKRRINDNFHLVGLPETNSSI